MENSYIVNSDSVSSTIVEFVNPKKKLTYVALTPDAKDPVYSSAGAACFDLSSTTDGIVSPGHAAKFGTGLAFNIPENHVMLTFSRSGHGFKNGIRLVNSVGVIDSDYRGEVGVGLHNDSDVDFVVNKGDRIAQALILTCEQFDLVRVDSLTETERGSNGFGSTGVK